MKYILIASLLSSAVLAAPFAQQGNRNGNGGNNNNNGGGNQQASQQSQQGGASQQQQGGTTQQQGNGQSQQQGTQNVNTGAGAGTTGANGQTPTAGDLATAVSNWMADTSMVSNFLNTGASIQNNAAFKQAALVAYNAEVDELNHKAIIDAANSGQPNVQAANSTLATGGAFQDVVDKLQIMSVQGKAAANNIDLINQNRCTNVLPNIDAYMASTGSSSQAVRPQVCDQTGVAGGVQGNGPTLPGQPAGTPQAAFAAAQALQQGTGNGQLDLQTNGIPAAQAAAQAGNPAPQTNNGGNTGNAGSTGTGSTGTGSTGTGSTGNTGAQGTTGTAGQQTQGQQSAGGQNSQGTANGQQGSQNQNQNQQGQAGGATQTQGGNSQQSGGAAGAQSSTAAGGNASGAGAGTNAAAGGAASQGTATGAAASSSAATGGKKGGKGNKNNN